MSAFPVTHAPRYVAIDDVHDIAMQAQYLIGGYDAMCRLQKTNSFLQDSEGHIAVTHRLSTLGVVVHDFLQTPAMKKINDAADWPGVFEYEITEELGQWFHANSRCSDAEFLAELERVTGAWLGDSFLHGTSHNLKAVP